MVDLLGGERAAFGLHVVAAEFAAMEFFNGVFDWQTMAIPTGDVLRIKASQLARFDDHVLQYFIERMANVQFAVRIGRAVM